ncbi:ABC-three component system middle component 2 [Burkholderia multivorans]|uniref:ABC-three component system middle component 2 n=1 Tax=Burkholderia multivorans TaxID=87883 RepID=UPI0030C8725E
MIGTRLSLILRESSCPQIRGAAPATFLTSVSSSYLLALKDRAAWLVETLGDLTDEQFKGVMRSFFDKWVEEFQQVERSL